MMLARRPIEPTNAGTNDDRLADALGGVEVEAVAGEARGSDSAPTGYATEYDQVSD